MMNINTLCIRVGLFVMACNFTSSVWSYSDAVLTYKATSPAKHGEMLVSYPDDWQASDQRPVMIIFHGGSWVGGDSIQLQPQARYFADRGIVAISANYRLGRIANAVIDARSCVRWVKENATSLGIDPTKVIVGGASAGAHLAACCYTATGVDDPNDNLAISPVPNLLVMLNPALSLSNSRVAQVEEDLGPELGQLLQVNDVLAADVPPASMQYGMNDIRREDGFEWVTECKVLGAEVHCWMADDQGHSFFNRYPWLERTLYIWDEFLQSHGYLTGPPTVQLPDDDLAMWELEIGGEVSEFIPVSSVVSVISEESGSPAERLIDESGLSGPTLDAMHSNVVSHMWQTRNGFPTSELILDFGDVTDFTHVHIWNFLRQGKETRAAKTVEVWGAPDEDVSETNFSLLATLSVFKNGLFAQNFEVPGFGVRLVKLKITLNHGAGVYSGLSEVKFSNQLQDEPSGEEENGGEGEEENGGDNMPPLAIVTADQTNGVAPLPVSFDASGSLDDGTIVLYEWDLDGDGTIDASGADWIEVSQTYLASGTYTVTLTVTDDANATHSATLEISVEEDVPEPPAPESVLVNFQPARSAVPAGYIPDTGAVFADRGNGFSYGWELSNTKKSRERNNDADQLWDTINHMDWKGIVRVWEIAVPNGEYEVALGCGDPSYTNSANDMDIEGVIVLDDDIDNRDEYTVSVSVTDGRLTVTQAESGINAKIAFIQITPILH